MPVSRYVSVILDPEFGCQLHQQIKLGAVWISDTPTNRIAVEKHWSEHRGQRHIEGVTTFTVLAAPEDVLVGSMEMIDLHHGPLSSKEPYRVLEVIGVQLNQKVEGALRKFGFIKFESDGNGIKAFRPDTDQ